MAADEDEGGGGDSGGASDGSDGGAMKAAARKKKDKKKKKAMAADEDTSSGANIVVTEAKSSHPKQFVPRKKARTKMLPHEMAMVARIADAKNIRTTIPRFGRYRFPTFQAFLGSWRSYTALNNALYRLKHSLRREPKNVKLKEEYEKKEEKALSRGLTCPPLHLIPEKLSHFEITARCVHGCTQSTRGMGERYSAATRYTGCSATIHAKAVRNDATGAWDVEVDNEICEHNHSLSSEIFESYNTSSEITDAALFEEVAAMLAADGNARLICDIISRRLGRPYTSRQLNNFRNYRLGGSDALACLKTLLETFAALDDSRLLIMQDDEGLMTGLALQTSIQRAMFDRWGTTCYSTGLTGQTTLDITSSKDMMRAVFNRFVEWNPDAVAKVQSFVIDKDYVEWAVLQEVFPNSEVVLCQFHVLKWFKHVKPKYGIPVSMRDDVMDILRALVYAPSDEDYEHNQVRLAELLGAPQHQSFLLYMHDQWYSCSKMWCNGGRGQIFTAINSTTNRIESMWMQYKGTLGKKQRIDKCVETVFVHATAVLRRERRFITDYLSKTILHQNLDPFVESLFRELSPFACKPVRAQFNKYQSSSVVAGIQLYFATPVEPGSRRMAVRVVGKRTVVAEVEAGHGCEWKCSCGFFKRSSMPCRHMFFVARDIDKTEEFPVQALAARWNMIETATLLAQLNDAIEALEGLRIGATEPQAKALDIPSNEWNSLDDDLDDGSDGESAPGHSNKHICPDVTANWFLARGRVSSVAIVTLRRGEKGNAVVLGDIEKRNVVMGQIERLTNYMMVQGVARYHKCAIELEIVVSALLKSWQAATNPTIQATSSGSVAPADDEIAFNSGHHEAANGSTYGVEQESYDEDYFDAAGGGDDSFEAVGFEEDAPSVNVHDSALDLFEYVPLDASPSSDTAVRFPRVQTPESSPLEFTTQVYGDIWSPGVDLESTLRATVERGVADAGRKVWNSPPPPPPPPPPQLARGHVVGRVLSLEEVLAGVDKDSSALQSAHATQGANISTINVGCATSAVEPMTPSALSSSRFRAPLTASALRKRKLLHDIDEEMEAEEASRNTAPGGATLRATDEAIPAVYNSFNALSTGAGARVDTPSRNTRAAKRGEIATITIPAVIAKGARHRTGQTSTNTGKRKLALQQVGDCPVFLDEFLVAVRWSSLSAAIAAIKKYDKLLVERAVESRGAKATRAFVMRAQHRFNFVVPVAVYEMVKAAINQARLRDRRPTDISESGLQCEDDREQYVVTITSKIRAFSEDTVYELGDFFARERLLGEGAKDLNWVTASSNWAPLRHHDKALRPVPFLQDEVNVLENLINSLGTEAMREAISLAFSNMSMETVLSVPRRSCRISVQEILGHLARKAKLNDSVVNFALSLLASRFDDAVVVDSLSNGKMMLPPQSLKYMRVVLFPVNMSNAHWGIICVSLPTTSGATAFLYDPLIGPWHDQLEEAWRTWCLPLLEQWFHRDQMREGVVAPPLIAALRPIKVEYPQTPKQADSYNCGLYCVLQGYTYLHDAYDIQNFDSLNDFQLKHVRLRLLWLTLCKSQSINVVPKAEAAIKIMATFNAYVDQRLVGTAAVQKCTKTA